MAERAKGSAKGTKKWTDPDASTFAGPTLYWATRYLFLRQQEG